MVSRLEPRLTLHEQSLGIEISRHLDPEAVDEGTFLAARAGSVESFHHALCLRLFGFARHERRKNRGSVIRTHEALGAITQSARIPRFLRRALRIGEG